MPAAVSDALPQIQLPSAPPSPPDPGRPQGPGGWAWDTAPQPSSLLTPVTIYGHFQAPVVPPPALPASQAHRQALGGAQELPAHPWPCALLDARHRAEGEGQDSFRETQSQPLLPTGPETLPRRKVCLHPPCTEKRPPLKGARTPSLAPAHFQGRGVLRGPPGPVHPTQRPQAGPAHHHLPALDKEACKHITTHRPDWGSERAS